MNTCLDTQIENSSVYNSAWDFSKKNGFYKNKSFRDGSYYSLIWKNNNDISLIYEFSIDDPFPGEHVALCSNARSSEFIFPNALKHEALFIRHNSSSPHADVFYFFRHKDSANPYLNGVFKALKIPNGKINAEYQTNLIKTDFSNVQDYLSNVLEFFQNRYFSPVRSRFVE